MTREEAINRLEDTFEAWERWNPHNDSPSSKLSEALGMAIAALREQPRWIPVEERLPDKRMDVLIFTWDCDTYIADYIPSVKQWWVENDLRSDVSHWMPLTEPPEVEV